MYTCDNCRRDTHSPENLTRVWWYNETYQEPKKEPALLCYECVELLSEEIEIAEEDESWVY